MPPINRGARASMPLRRVACAPGKRAATATRAARPATPIDNMTLLKLYLSICIYYDPTVSSSVLALSVSMHLPRR